MNIAQTKILTVEKQNDDVEEIVDGGEGVKGAGLVKYLGCSFTREGDKNRRERTKRMTKYRRCVCSLSPVLKDRYIHLEQKERHSNSNSDINMCIGKLELDDKGLEKTSGSRDENSQSYSGQNKA